MTGTPTVAIIGRPNVGKSTLFNRLIGGRDAIVDARPGVSRDRHFGAAEWNGRRFWLVDTGGMGPGPHAHLNRAVRTQVEAAVAASDVVLFVVDVEEGVHPADLEIAQYLRTARRAVILVANKADQLPNDTRHLAFYELGLGGGPVPGARRGRQELWRPAGPCRGAVAGGGRGGRRGRTPWRGRGRHKRGK